MRKQIFFDSLKFREPTAVAYKPEDEDVIKFGMYVPHYNEYDSDGKLTDQIAWDEFVPGQNTEWQYCALIDGEDAETMDMWVSMEVFDGR